MFSLPTKFTTHLASPIPPFRSSKSNSSNPIIFREPPISIPPRNLHSPANAAADKMSSSPRNFTHLTSPPCFSNSPKPPISIPAATVSEKLQTLNTEFKSLPQPIDRVKKLLHYAALLPRPTPSLRTQDHRVKGCTAEVWVSVKTEGNGVMRFEMDSDSEITKGFCYCLLWVMDGAEMEEVLSVGCHDLVEMNVGLFVRGNSRVNTWGNVLFAMQKRATELVVGEEGQAPVALVGGGGAVAPVGASVLSLR